jgi:hypothetical protein
MNSYWDLYVAYVNKCVRNNWINDIDPHHYEMEWNHWLPRACFPDILLGQWLTKQQHAIASALQTLALRENCMFGWHKKYLPNTLVELAWPYFRQSSRKAGLKGGPIGAQSTHSVRDELGRSLQGVKAGKRLHAEKDELGRSVNSMKASQILNAVKDENGKSVNAVKGGIKGIEKTNAEKDESGRSVNAVKGAKTLHARKDESGRSAVTMRVNSQIWESMIDGFRSNAGAVASYNKARGWDPNARRRVG